MSVWWTPLCLEPKCIKPYGFGTIGGILFKGISVGFSGVCNFFNVYAPYLNRRIFWDSPILLDILSLPNLVLASDFNLTLSDAEVWRATSRSDPLTSHFQNYFSSLRLNDIEPFPLNPAWSNGRMGLACVSKRLDRFMLVDSLL